MAITTEAIRFWRLRAVDLSTSKQLKAGAETQQTTKPPNADRRVLWAYRFFFLNYKQLNINYMLIHGKQLTITNDGCGIYYDHIKIMDKDGSVKLNEWTDWDYWVNRISNNPNFDPKIYHPTLQK